MKTSLTYAFSFVVGLFSVASHSPAQAAATAVAAQAPAATAEVKDAPIEPWRRELLQLAFAAASRFPLDPHVKNRSRDQGMVVDTCFDLEQPQLAVGLARDIVDWHRAAAYADFAFHCGKCGDRPRAESYLRLVDGLLGDRAFLEKVQDWQRDLVRVKVARALLAIGEKDKAAAATGSIDATSTQAVDPDWGRTAADRVRQMTVEQARAEIGNLDRDFLSMSLGQQSAALQVVAAMHERFYTDTVLRVLAEKRLLELYDKMPPKLRLDAIATLARTAIANQGLEHAQQLVIGMQQIVEHFTWRAEDRVPELARIAELRFGAGLQDRGRDELDKALADYHQHRDEIVDIYRAGALRALALAYATVGDQQKALDLLANTLEEGMENPNSRPRCDDFVATCCAMAKAGIEPSKAMAARLREICEGLGEPW